MPVPSPIDYAGLRKAMVKAVITYGGLSQNQVVMAEPTRPGSPRPQLPFVTIKVTSPGQAAGDDTLTTLADGRTNVGGQRRMTVDLNAYGRDHDEAYGLMAALTVGMQNDPQNIFAAQKVAVWNTGDLRDLSFLMATGFEGRCQMEVIVGMASNAVLDYGTIEGVDVIGVVDVPPQNDLYIQARKI